MVDAHPGLRGSIDGVGIHPYASSPDGVLARIVGLRAAMNDLGLADVPIDVTEVGWPTSGLPPPTPVPDAVRAQAFAEVAEGVAASGCGVERFLPHTWVTRERNPLVAGEWFGITHPDGSPSQTAIAYATAVRDIAAGNTPSAGTLPRCTASAAAPSVGAGAWLGLGSAG
jgi:hypothetical protein